MKVILFKVRLVWLISAHWLIWLFFCVSPAGDWLFFFSSLTYEHWCRFLKLQSSLLNIQGSERFPPHPPPVEKMCYDIQSAAFLQKIYSNTCQQLIGGFRYLTLSNQEGISVTKDKIHHHQNTDFIMSCWTISFYKKQYFSLALC